MTQPYDPIEESNPRQTMVRVVLFLIILGTLPFYVLGFVLWGTAPDANANAEETLVTATNTIIGDDNPTGTATLRDTSTPFPTVGPLNPTPLQFRTPQVFPTIPPVVIPTGTNAPTLTPFPTNTPFPTSTPLPTITPPPTETPLPPPSDTPAPETTANP